MGVEARAVALRRLGELAVELGRHPQEQAAAVAAVVRGGRLDASRGGRRHGLTLRPPRRHGNGSFLTLGRELLLEPQERGAQGARHVDLGAPDPAGDLVLAEVLQVAQQDDPAFRRRQ